MEHEPTKNLAPHKVLLQKVMGVFRSLPGLQNKPQLHTQQHTTMPGMRNKKVNDTKTKATDKKKANSPHQQAAVLQAFGIQSSEAGVAEGASDLRDRADSSSSGVSSSLPAGDDSSPSYSWQAGDEPVRHIDMVGIMFRGMPSSVDSSEQREGSAGNGPVSLAPRITHVWSGAAIDPETARRMGVAARSWETEEVICGNWREMNLSNVDMPRDAKSVGDPSPLPFIHDMVEACLDGRDEDIILITNADIGLRMGLSVEIAALCKLHGACFAHRWDFDRIDQPITHTEQLTKGKWYVGADAFAFTQKWWIDNRTKLPDFILGRECWDWILRELIKETGGAELHQAIWHESHQSPWKKGRANHPGNIYNRSYARAWLNQRKLPLREIAHAPFKPVVWPPPKWLQRKKPVIEDGTLDVLIVLGRGSKWENTELRYCLRSLEQHAKNMRRIFVVGNDPGFLSKEVTVIPRPDAGKNKEHSIAEQVCWAAANLDMTEHFLWVNDDTFFIEDVDIARYPYYVAGDLGNKWRKTKPGGYRIALAQTEAQLMAKKFPTINYELHTPLLYSKSGMSKLGKWLELSSKVKFGMTWRSIYCNVLGVPAGPTMKDSKIGNANTPEEVEAQVKGRHSFSIGDGFSDAAKGWFATRWPNKSKYEQ